MTQKDFIAELSTELTMRRKVWQKIPGKSDQFTDFGHNLRYNLMLKMQDFFTVMTPQEFHTITERMARKAAESQAQTELFK